ncbi:MAG: hypothetical protein KAI83_15370 [Thiomargarita sp.]|nr:hypothetical protein [Thiomargarita sp.]
MEYNALALSIRPNLEWTPILTLRRFLIKKYRPYKFWSILENHLNSH